MRPEFVIFDMDGLILDSERLFMEQKEIVMRRYGYRQSREDYLQTIGTGGEILRKILERLYGKDYPMDAVTRETRELVDQWIDRNGPPVKEGIRSLMEKLREAGIPCGVATTTHTPIARSYMEKAGLLPYLRFVLGGERVTRSKPDPEIFLLAAEQAGASPEQCLVLEDSPNGIRSALAAGMSVIAIPDMIPVPEELKDQILREVSSAEEVAGILEIG